MWYYEPEQNEIPRTRENERYTYSDYIYADIDGAY